jgi:hypothetical protein
LCGTGKYKGRYPSGEEILKKPSLDETAIGKFENFFFAKLLCFRLPKAAFLAICAGVLAVNLGC